jgi:hypothetical protein
MADSFNTFQYWRPCLPDIEDELQEFLSDSESMMLDTSGPEMAEENPQFNNFNYWRAPIADIDICNLGVL